MKKRNIKDQLKNEEILEDLERFNFENIGVRKTRKISFDSDYLSQSNSFSSDIKCEKLPYKLNLTNIRQRSYSQQDKRSYHSFEDLSDILSEKIEIKRCSSQTESLISIRFSDNEQSENSQREGMKDQIYKVLEKCGKFSLYYTTYRRKEQRVKHV